MSEVELKPCPFCGKEAAIFEYPREGYFTIRCTGRMKCIAGHAWFPPYRGEEAAVKAWNNRVTLSENKIEKLLNIAKKMEAESLEEHHYTLSNRYSIREDGLSVGAIKRFVREIRETIEEKDED